MAHLSAFEQGMCTCTWYTEPSSDATVSDRSSGAIQLISVCYCTVHLTCQSEIVHLRHRRSVSSTRDAFILTHFMEKKIVP